jgi:26S proteasome regulatory subunit N2
LGAARCLDQYCEQRQKHKEEGEGAIDKRLVLIVERMISRCTCCLSVTPGAGHALNLQLCRCCEHGQYEQAVGIAVEARRLDKLEEVVTSSQDLEDTLNYALKVVQALDSDREFRQQVDAAVPAEVDAHCEHVLICDGALQALRSLVLLSEKVANPDYAGICQRLMFLDDAPAVAGILSRLLNGPEVLHALCGGSDRPPC